MERPGPWEAWESFHAKVGFVSFSYLLRCFQRFDVIRWSLGWLFIIPLLPTLGASASGVNWCDRAANRNSSSVPVGYDFQPGAKFCLLQKYHY
jgi:hypothetical protein